MSRKRYVSQRKLSELTEQAGQVFGLTELNRVMAPYAYFDDRVRYVCRRKALWAALHNRLNVGHPKGPRKPHKWTVRNAN